MDVDIKQESRGKFLNFLIKLRSLNVFFIFLVIMIILGVLSPGHRFLSKENLKVFLAYGSEFNIVALAIGILMISGEFDLSVGSILVFCCFAILKLFDAGVNIYIAAILTLGIGAAIGLLNGFITVKAKIPSFITTLGTMMFWRGFTILLSKGLQKPLNISEYPFFNNVLVGDFTKIIPMQFIWFIVIAVIFGLLMHFHKFGNWVFSTGDNKEAARAMGINTDNVKMICFSVVGLICSFVAIMQIVRLGSFSSRSGDGWELKAIAASVVGGTSLTGGIGNMFGIFLGALIISAIENGLVIMRLPYSWTYTIFGIVIVSSVIFSLYIEKKRLSIGKESQ